MNVSDYAQVAFQAGYIAAEFDFVSSPTKCSIYADLLALSPDRGTVLAAAWMRGYKRRCDEDDVNEGSGGSRTSQQALIRRSVSAM
jgi:hypothetical protein